MDVSAKDLAKNKFKSHRKYSRGGRGQRSGRDDNFERLVPEVGSNAHRYDEGDGASGSEDGSAEEGAAQPRVSRGADMEELLAEAELQYSQRQYRYRAFEHQLEQEDPFAGRQAGAVPAAVLELPVEELAAVLAAVPLQCLLGLPAGLVVEDGLTTAGADGAGGHASDNKLLTSTSGLRMEAAASGGGGGGFMGLSWADIDSLPSPFAATLPSAATPDVPLASCQLQPSPSRPAGSASALMMPQAPEQQPMPVMRAAALPASSQPASAATTAYMAPAAVPAAASLPPHLAFLAGSSGGRNTSGNAGATSLAAVSPAQLQSAAAAAAMPAAVPTAPLLTATKPLPVAVATSPAATAAVATTAGDDDGDDDALDQLLAASGATGGAQRPQQPAAVAPSLLANTAALDSRPAARETAAAAPPAAKPAAAVATAAALHSSLGTTSTGPQSSHAAGGSKTKSLEDWLNDI